MLETATVDAASRAAGRAEDVTIWAGMAETRLPVSRRKPDGKGGVVWRPAPDEPVCNALPLCVFKNAGGTPVCMLFSVSCHPSSVGTWEISADYVGPATRMLNQALGIEEGALFLQGCGGDAKPVTISDGRDDAGPLWRSGTWEDVEAAGRIIADDAAPVLAGGLAEVKPCLRAHALTMALPLQPPKSKAWHEDLAAHPETWPGDAELIQKWAARQVEILQSGEPLLTEIGVTVQGMQLGENLRIIGIEGETVGALGRQVLDFFAGGVTFPLGYIDATLIYLPTSAQIPEGGYEVDSYYEYGHPAPLARGTDMDLAPALEQLRAAGIQ